MATRSASSPLLIRNSERGSFKRCRQAWYWNFVELYKPNDEQPALRFGDLIHRTLEAHYPVGVKRKGKPWLIFEKLYDAELEQGREDFKMWAEDEKWLDAKEMGMTMMRGFYDLYRDEDEAYEVISSEQVFQIPLRFSPAERARLQEITGEKKNRVMIVGTMDGVWRDRSGPKKSRPVFIKEYKTTGSAISHVINGLPMDEQAGTYWTYGPRWLWLQGVLPEGVYPTHIWYTIMRKGMPDLRPKDELGRALNKPSKDALVEAYRDTHGEDPPKGSTVASLTAALGETAAAQLGEISSKQPSPLFEREKVYRDNNDRERMHQRVKDESIEMISARAGKMAIIKNPGPLFMPNCTMCQFRGPCELHESGHDYESMFRGLYKKWDPYAAHEVPERW